MSRTAKTSFTSVEQAEGMGARVRRSIGRPELRNFDPFLMLDEFKGKAPAGFPDHPHRGFETITYNLKGEIHHQDFLGHKGIIGPGDLQWMSAGRGIVHSEMPGKEEVHGLQLWVNLKSSDKMMKPVYQELLDTKIPRGEKDGVKVKVIAGEAFAIKSPVYTRTPTYYLDFKMAQGSKLEQLIPKEWNAFVYVLAGEAYFGPEDNQTLCQAHQTMTFNQDGTCLMAHNKGQSECHFMMISGEPIGEPVAQRGPFVMNTEAELKQAYMDFQLGQNGFENAPTWKSDKN